MFIVGYLSTAYTPPPMESQEVSQGDIDTRLRSYYSDADPVQTCHMQQHFSERASPEVARGGSCSGKRLQLRRTLR